VKRAVWLRAGGRCEWILPSRERCDCTRTLEYDHILALALGGKSTIENVRLACRPPVESPRFRGERPVGSITYEMGRTES
jgi:5-methylcytosine-specific restriction endonuclease McrA